MFQSFNMNVGVFAAVIVALASWAFGCPAAGQVESRTEKELPPATGNQDDAQPLTRYATDDFFAGAFLNLDAILASSSYQDFPVDLLIPSSVLFDWFRSSPVTEIAVFLKDAANLKRDVSGELEIAACVRLDQPMEPEEFLSRMSKLLDPFQRRAKKFSIEKVTVGARQCYRVPAGTFLNARRKTGKLHFTEEDGSIKPQGINVGDFTPSQYVQGGSKETAVITKMGVSPADLQVNQLRLALRMTVFRTKMLDDEFSKAQLFLRRPGGELATAPITFDAKSFVETTFAFPRELMAIDAKGVPVEVDLFNDLVVRGQIEVVVRSLNEHVYLGFVPESVNVKMNSFEFLAFEDKEIVIAQSVETLKSMLDQPTKSELSKKMNQAGEEIVVAASIQNRVQRNRLKLFLSALALEKVATYIPNDNFSLIGTAEIGETTSGHLKISVEDQERTGSLQRLLRRDLAAARPLAKEFAIESIRRLDTMDRLGGMFFPEISRGCPIPLDDRFEFESHLEATLGDFFDGVNIDVVDDTLSIDYRPVRQLGNESRLDQLVLASLELKRAYELGQQNKFHIGDQVHSRATERLKGEFSAWARRAHQLTYNTSVEFDGFEGRYEWVRRGIEVLLDGAEQNPDSFDLVWMTANFIGLKMGKSDERREYQKLFANDSALHERLARYIDLSQARSIDGQVESWLVAKLLFAHCVEQHVEFGKAIHVEPFVFYSRVARAQAGYAEALNERGKFDRAARQWQTAEQLYDEFGSTPIFLAGSVKFNDLKKPEDESQKKDPATPKPSVIFENFGKPYDPENENDDGLVKRIDNLTEMFQGWVWRAKFEQSDTARSLRKNARDARMLLRQGRLEESGKRFLAAMQTVSKLIGDHPDQTNQIFEAVPDILTNYQQVVRQLGKPVDESLEPTIEAFQQFKSNHSMLPWR